MKQDGNFPLQIEFSGEDLWTGCVNESLMRGLWDLEES